MISFSYSVLDSLSSRLIISMLNFIFYGLSISIPSVFLRCYVIIFDGWSFPGEMPVVT